MKNTENKSEPGSSNGNLQLDFQALMSGRIDCPEIENERENDDKSNKAILIICIDKDSEEVGKTVSNISFIGNGNLVVRCLAEKLSKLEPENIVHKLLLDAQKVADLVKAHRVCIQENLIDTDKL